jgi:hypothetical protein
MQACAAGVGAITPRARERLDAAMATIAGQSDDTPFDTLIATRDALLALTGA